MENIIVYIILAVAAFFIGRRFYRQWKNALSSGKVTSCESGCCSCSDIDCSESQSGKMH